MLQIILNGQKQQIHSSPDRRLIDVLREEFKLTGTKEGCGIGECGACTVLVDDMAVNSCLVLVGQVTGKSVTTVEGLTVENELHPLQENFLRHGAIQCGFCTPGV